MSHRTFILWTLIILLFASFAGVVGWGLQGRLTEAGFAWVVGVVAAWKLVPYIDGGERPEDG